MARLQGMRTAAARVLWAVLAMIGCGQAMAQTSASDTAVPGLAAVPRVDGSRSDRLM